MTRRKRPWGYSAKSQPAASNQWELHPDTLSVRGGLTRSGFGETGEALYLTSGFTYDSAEAATASFADEEEHYLYSRFHNPTVAVFEERLAALEGAELCVATGSGMSAMFASVASLISAGDHIVASASMFSSCYVVLAEILPKWGVTVEFVKGNNPSNWERALNNAKTKVVFIETPSNPMLEIVDIEMVSTLAHNVGALVVIDNVMASPVLQKPLQHGADVIMYSATKHIDGQGRVLGGAILGSEDYIKNTLQPFVRHTGPNLSAFNAWILLKSLETMHMRVNKMNENATAVAEFLSSHPNVESVNYPGLASHKDAAIVKKQMLGGGTTLSFSLKGGESALFAAMNALQVIDISNNLGDSKSLITHPASTTHRRLGPEVQAEMGILPTLARLSLGLEHESDLIKDLANALSV